jgi:hypothetical protein
LHYQSWWPLRKLVAAWDAHKPEVVLTSFWALSHFLHHLQLIWNFNEYFWVLNIFQYWAFYHFDHVVTVERTSPLKSSKCKIWSQHLKPMPAEEVKPIWRFCSNIPHTLCSQSCHHKRLVYSKHRIQLNFSITLT